MKKLIVTADDFGLTAGVNAAIAIASRDGIVTTASLMVTGAAFDSAVDIARSRPQLDLGLHLNLTEGAPVSRSSTIASLAGAFGFRYAHPSMLATGLLIRRVRLLDVEREVRSQIEKAIAAGLHITHIDGHKHVHAIPAVLSVIARVIHEYGIHAIRCVRETVPRLRAILARNKGSWRQITLQYGFGKVLSWMMPRRGTSTVLTPERFYGVTQTGFLDSESLKEILGDLVDGTNEVMCHPGYVDDDLRQMPTRLHAQRERELRLLTASETRDLVRRSGVSLTTYKALVEDYGKRGSNPLLHRYSAV